MLKWCNEWSHDAIIYVVIHTDIIASYAHKPCFYLNKNEQFRSISFYMCHYDFLPDDYWIKWNIKNMTNCGLCIKFCNFWRLFLCPTFFSLQVATDKDNGILLYKEDHDPLAIELYQGHIRLIYDIANYPPTTVYRYAT